MRLAQQLAATFNDRYGKTFPICEASVDREASATLNSLRNPTVKMSKSDPDLKSRIVLTDSPKVLLSKVKKALTDFTSEVTYDLDGRPGVANLLHIHAQMSGESVPDIVQRLHGADTGK